MIHRRKRAGKKKTSRGHRRETARRADSDPLSQSIGSGKRKKAGEKKGEGPGSPERPSEDGCLTFITTRDEVADPIRQEKKSPRKNPTI